MKDEDVIQGNKLIAEFMQDTFIYKDTLGEYAKYHSDWNRLMPVVEKIEDEFIYVTIKTFACEIGYRNGGAIIQFKEDKPKILAVWKACIEFIKTVKCA